MTEPRNAFEHQRFRLRRPDGTRLKKSLRAILTEPDDAYALDYPQEFYNVAALNLMAYLAQTAFEPERTSDLAARVAEPMTEAAFDEAVERLRPRFALTGDGPRFMQGPPPENDKKAEPLAVAVMIAPKGDRQFLHRADEAWVVTPEQAGLFLFARNTFYEGTGGRGYQKGTNGDTPIRTLVTVPAADGAIHLRQSLWLNVLARETQRAYPGDYANPHALREKDYDEFFWEKLPERDVPVGGITLRAGLGWMTAFHWLHFEESEEGWTCPVTGETVTGLLAPRVTKRSTGIAYGAKGDLDAGVRAERLFRHPNVPTQKSFSKKPGQYENERPFQVNRLTGIVDALGAALFGAHAHESGEGTLAAPVLVQLYGNELMSWAKRSRLLVFGFHMLSAQKNVHGGYELDTFAFRPLGRSEAETRTLTRMARERMEKAADFAGDVEKALQRAVQRTAGAGVRAKENEDGKIVIEKTEPVRSSDFSFGRDALAGFWQAVQHEHVPALVGWIAEAASEGPGGLTSRKHEIQKRWEDAVVDAAKRLYRPVFDQYSTLPRTMPYAHAARRIFFGALKKARTVQLETENA